MLLSFELLNINKFRNIFLIYFLFLNLNLFAQVSGAGGITISISPKIDASFIKKIQIKENTIILKKAGKKHTIELPNGTIEYIFDMVSYNQLTPIIFSQDNFFFGTTEESSYKKQRGNIQKKSNIKVDSLRNSFSPFPNLDINFLQNVFYYDIFIHCLICESMQLDSIKHPFYQKENISPRQEVKKYLDLMYSNNEDTIGYWKIIENYPNSPSCIGTINFFIEPSSYLPIQLTVKTSKFFVTQDWENEITVLGEEEASIAAVPYKLLAKDIEENWNEYREQFSYVEELSSIIEAYSILKLLKESNNSLFEKLKKQVKNNSTSITALKGKQIVSPILDEQEWLNNTKLAIGDNIDGFQEARMELAVLMAEKNILDSIVIDEIKHKELLEASELDTNFHLLWLLFTAINEKEQKALLLYNDFFSEIQIVSDSLERYKLWSLGVKWLTTISNELYKDKDLYLPLLEKQKLNLITDFSLFLKNNSLNSNTESKQINKIILLIYQSGILRIATNKFSEKDENEKYTNPILKEFIVYVVNIHYQAAIKEQPNNIEIIHFHYRFISYLQKLIPDELDKKDIDKKIEKISVLLKH